MIRAIHLEIHGPGNDRGWSDRPIGECLVRVGTVIDPTGETDSYKARNRMGRVVTAGFQFSSGSSLIVSLD